MVKKYESIGFEKHFMFSGIRFNSNVIKDEKTNTNIKFSHDFNINEVVAMDSNTFMDQNREPMFSMLINNKNNFSLAAYDGDKIVGFGLLRKASVGYRLAPLYASSDTIAINLLCELCDLVPNQTIDVDFLHQNKFMMDLSKKHEMLVLDNVIRMFKPGVLFDAPRMNTSNLYGMCSWEVG
ncbi:hypothetical protein AKO1_006469 [Acrasis kona]|uniref:YitH/HolE acetyltransferase (GNAT) domain-containing protein n=1 Tax=Acrasis kona TaxID=1008807 RepID=A0AAW2YIY3_9EUKA